jgi:hypothetical protein
MLAEEDVSDNQLDNNNEKSASSANGWWRGVRASKRKRPLSLRKCESESNVRRRLEIDEMGSNVSRSKSLDNMETDSIVYEALTHNKAAKRDENSLCGFESEDDYKLLASSEDEVEPCGAISPAHSTPDSHDHAEIADSDLSADGEQPTPAATRQEHSTLPRVDDEVFVRLSAAYKSLVSDNVAREAPKPCRSTTLPKTRSRQIDSRKRSSVSHTPAAIIPASLESTSGTGKNDFFSSPAKPDLIAKETNSDGEHKARRSRANLSWLRKSMRKLYPFQMPQVQNAQPQASAPPLDMPTPSTSDSRGESHRDKRAAPAVPPPNPDLFSIVLTEQRQQQQESDANRPRQYGRRSNPVRIASFAIEADGNNGTPAVRWRATRYDYARNLIPSSF